MQPRSAISRIIAAATAAWYGCQQVSMRRLGSEKQTVMPLDGALAALADEAVPPDVRRMKAAA